MELLYRVLQGGSIYFVKQVVPHPNFVIWCYTDQQAVEGCMMKLAHRYAVGDRRHPTSSVLSNVRCIDEFAMPKVAEGAA